MSERGEAFEQSETLKHDEAPTKDEALRRDEVLRRFVESYDIEVPDETVEQELEFMKLDMQHRMRYDALSKGLISSLPQSFSPAQEDELRELALYEVKSSLVIKELISTQGFTASSQELIGEAERIAREQNSSIDMVKRFFGDDFAGLERSVLEGKAIDWICKQQLPEQHSAQQEVERATAQESAPTQHDAAAQEPPTAQKHTAAQKMPVARENDTDAAFEDNIEIAINAGSRIISRTVAYIRRVLQGDVIVLSVLMRNPSGTSIDTIVETTVLTRPRITQILNSLEERGYVERQNVDQDKRRISVYITQAGREVCMRMRKEMRELTRVYLTQLTPEELESFAHILQKLSTMDAHQEDAMPLMDPADFFKID